MIGALPFDWNGRFFCLLICCAKEDAMSINLPPWMPLVRSNALTVSEHSDPTAVPLPDGGYARVWTSRAGHENLG